MYADRYGVSEGIMSKMYEASNHRIPDELLKWSLRKALNNARSYEHCSQLTRKWEMEELPKIINSLKFHTN